MPQQAAQPATAEDRLRVDLHLRQWVASGTRRAVAQPLMRPEPVVIFRISLNDVIELPQAETEQPNDAVGRRGRRTQRDRLWPRRDDLHLRPLSPKDSHTTWTTSWGAGHYLRSDFG